MGMALYRGRSSGEMPVRALIKPGGAPNLLVPRLPGSLEGSRLTPARLLWLPPLPTYPTPTQLWQSSDRGYGPMTLRDT